MLKVLKITNKRNHKNYAQIEKKYVYFIFTEDICSVSCLMQVLVFCKNVLINLVKERLTLKNFRALRVA